MGSFDGRVVLITGAAGGIGRALCEVFGIRGARIVANDLNREGLDNLVKSLEGIGVSVLAEVADVSDTAAVQGLVEAAVSHYGRVDILVNNAALKTNRPGSNVPVTQMSDDLWDRTLAVNLRGPFLVSRAVARYLIRQGQGGRLINVTSAAWRTARAGAAHYCASKAGLVQLTRALALELAPHKVNVNAVSPGFIDVEPRPLPEARLAYIEARKKQIPWGRLGTPKDVAYAALFLASPEAEFITGTVLEVDGGDHAGIIVPPSSE